MKTISRESGKTKAKVTNERGQIEFLTMHNGWQWTGSVMTPELARLSIEMLTEYLNDNWDDPDK